MKFSKIKGNANHHLFRRGKRGTLWVRFFKAGKGPLERSLKTDGVEQARIQRDKEIAIFLGIEPKWKRGVLLVEDKFPEFVELKKIKAPATYASIRIQWEKHLKPYFSGIRIEDVTESEWLKYVAKKREESPDRKFFNDRKWLSMFLNWSHREGWLHKLPRLPDVDPEIKVGKVFSKTEIGKLVENSSGDLRLQILMGFTMGMRKSEVLTLEWSQVDFNRCSIYLPAEKTKIRKERAFAISAICYDLLLKKQVLKKSEWVFPGRRGRSGHVRAVGDMKAWTACRTRAGVEGRFHDLRHSFLTMAFKKREANPALICHYAGLSLEEAQRTYLHFDLDDTREVAGLVNI